MNEALTPFHVAVPVHDLALCRKFYREVLGCEEGRSRANWVDLNLYGHQYVLHLKPGMKPNNHHNPVDGQEVPVPHYGVILSWSAWHKLEERLISLSTKFIIEPYIRFEGEVGEQATMFLLDPSGNALEFKSFRDPSQLFAR